MPVRKLLHISTILLLLALKNIPRHLGISLLFTLSFVAIAIEILRKSSPKFQKFFLALFGRALKDDERRGKITGATFLILSMTLTYLIFPFKIFFYSSLIAILVDGITPVITFVIFSKTQKDRAHLLTFLISAIIVALVIDSGLPFLAKLISSVFISLIEYFNPPPDDNIYAEFLGAIIIYLLVEAL